MAGSYVPWFLQMCILTEQNLKFNLYLIGDKNDFSYFCPDLVFASNCTCYLSESSGISGSQLRKWWSGFFLFLGTCAFWWSPRLEAAGAQRGLWEEREHRLGHPGTDPCPASQRTEDLSCLKCRWRGHATCWASLSLVWTSLVARRPQIDLGISAFFWDTDLKEMVLDTQLPEWGPCAGWKSGEGRGGPLC